MNAARTLLLSTIALFTASTASAVDYRHIDRLALEVADQMNQLTREFSEHYVHTAQYQHLISDARDAARLADHIHELAHHRGCLYEIRSDLSRLDREFHHIEEVLAELNYLVRIGQGGHIHGDTRHVFYLMHELEENLHHLREDVGSNRRYSNHGGHDSHTQVYRPTRPVYYRGGSQHGQRSSCSSNRNTSSR